MPKSKEYNPSLVEGELLKLDLKKRLEEYNRIGEVIHEQVVEHQKKLGEELNHFESQKEKLKGK